MNTNQYVEVQRPIQGELVTRAHRINNMNNSMKSKNRVRVVKKTRPTFSSNKSERVIFGVTKSKHMTRRNRRSRRGKSRRSRHRK